MRRLIRAPKDFWTGVMFVAVGMAALWLARDYPMGSALKMGPGYFPTVLGGLLTLVGLAAALRAFLRPGPAIERFAWGEVSFVLGATLLFGVLVRGAGLAVAIPALVLVSAYASKRFRSGPALALALGLTVGCVLLFVKALGLPIPVVGNWFGS